MFGGGKLFFARYHKRMTLAVLFTYYNERSLLTEALESLAAQTLRPEEVWIYDDASSFPAADYVPANHPFRFLKILRGDSNLGPAKGRNQLLASTQADYVHFQDSDDVFLQGWAQAVRGAMQSSPDVVLTELRSSRSGKPYGNCFLNLKSLASRPDLTAYCLAHAVLPAAGTYRREFLQRAGGYREDLWQSEDYEFHIRLAMEGARYVAIETPLVEIRVREQSRSQKRGEVWEGRLLGLEILSSRLRKTHSSALAEAFAETGSELYRLGRKELARRAFGHGKEASFVHQNFVYRQIARWVGPEWSESLGSFYRLLLPSFLRKALRFAGR